jgi:hypothetical protein
LNPVKLAYEVEPYCHRNYFCCCYWIVTASKQAKKNIENIMQPDYLIQKLEVFLP